MYKRKDSGLQEQGSLTALRNSRLGERSASFEVVGDGSAVVLCPALNLLEDGAGAHSSPDLVFLALLVNCTGPTLH